MNIISEITSVNSSGNDGGDSDEDKRGREKILEYKKFILVEMVFIIPIVLTKRNHNLD